MAYGCIHHHFNISHALQGPVIIAHLGVNLSLAYSKNTHTFRYSSLVQTTRNNHKQRGIMNNADFAKLVVTGGGAGGDDDGGGGGGNAFRRKKKPRHNVELISKGAGGKVDRKHLLEALDKEEKIKKQHHKHAGEDDFDEDDEDEDDYRTSRGKKAARAEEIYGPGAR